MAYQLDYLIELTFFSLDLVEPENNRPTNNVTANCVFSFFFLRNEKGSFSSNKSTKSYKVVELTCTTCSFTFCFLDLVEPENKRPTNLVDPKFLNSQGEYIGPYNNLAICIQDNQPSPYDKDGLSLKVCHLQTLEYAPLYMMSQF